MSTHINSCFFKVKMDYLISLLYYLSTMLDGGLIFLHCGYMPHCTARVDKRFENYYTVQFMTGGGIDLYYGEEEEYHLTGKWFWAANHGPRIRFHPGAGYDYWIHRYVAFKGSLVERWMDSGLLLERPQPVPQGKDYTELFDNLLSNAIRTDRWGRLRAINLLESLLIELAEARMQRAPLDTWLDSVVAELSAGAEFMPDYEQLAQKFNMSLSTFRRRFRQAAGVSLHDYVLQRRTARARALLGESDLSIKEIAESLGYTDVYFFARQFRERVGIPPAAYRKSRQS